MREISKLYKKNHTSIITTFFVYVLLACGMVYLPVGIDLKDTYLGSGEVVFWSNYFWWFDFSTSNFLNPLRDNYIFYPIGLSMTDGIFPMMLFAPLTRFLGATVSYNIYLISTFALAGLGMFLLSRKLSISYLSSVMAGIIFAFFPFHFGAAMGHLHAFSIMWIPFFALAATNFIDRPSLRNTFIAAFTFAITALTSWTVAVMAALYFAIFLLFNYKELFKKSSFFRLIQFVCISTFLMIPGLYPLISEISTGEYTKPVNEFIKYSADLLSFITPSPLHPIWGSYFKNANSNFTGNISENMMFVGFSVLLFAVTGAVVSRKNNHARIMIFVTLFFLVLSLGPVLHIAGSDHFTENNITVKLPGMLEAYLPVLDMIRVPSRYIVMIMFGLSILAAFGMDHIARILSQKFSRLSVLPYAVQILGCALVIFEFMAVLPVQAVIKTPQFYYNIRDSHGASPILDVPIILMGTNNNDFHLDSKLMEYYYGYQKIHQKPIFGGYWSRAANNYERFLHSDPVLRYIYNQKKGIIDYPQVNPLIYLRKAYGVSHVVVHKSFMNNSAFKTITAYFGNEYIEDTSVEGDPLIVYSTEDIQSKSKNAESSPPAINIKLGNGWHRIDYWKDPKGRDIVPVRWMGGYGELIVDSHENKHASLRFTAYRYKKDRSVAVAVTNVIGTQELLTKLIANGPNKLTIPINISKGENVISIKSVNGTDKPCEDPAAPSEDCRDLSIAVQDISISTY